MFRFSRAYFCRPSFVRKVLSCNVSARFFTRVLFCVCVCGSMVNICADAVICTTVLITFRFDIDSSIFPTIHEAYKSTACNLCLSRLQMTQTNVFNLQSDHARAVSVTDSLLHNSIITHNFCYQQPTITWQNGPIIIQGHYLSRFNDICTN